MKKETRRGSPLHLLSPSPPHAFTCHTPLPSAGLVVVRIICCAVAVALLAGGCAAVPVAAVGTIAGAAASAVSTGSEIYKLGKLDTADMARQADAIRAARLAAADLGLTFKKEEPRKGGATRLEFTDAKGASLKVLVEPRTPVLVHLRIDVGWFGSEPVARLFLARLRTHLPPPAVPTTAPATRPVEG